MAAMSQPALDLEFDDGTDPTFTVGELADAVNQVLRRGFRDGVWVRGEIEGIQQRNGHVYFSLTDHNGRTRTLADFRGQVVVVFFGYTRCPDVCPTDLARKPRPGTVGKISDHCLTSVEAPPDGQVPSVGDVIHLPNPNWKEAKDVTGVTIRYRVVSRDTVQVVRNLLRLDRRFVSCSSLHELVPLPLAFLHLLQKVAIRLRRSPSRSMTDQAPPSTALRFTTSPSTISIRLRRPSPLPPTQCAGTAREAPSEPAKHRKPTPCLLDEGRLPLRPHQAVLYRV